MIQGWKLLVQWKDSTQTQVALQSIEQLYLVEVAEYVISNKFLEEPAIAWWVKDALWKRDCLVAKAQIWYWLSLYKYGVKLLKLVETALKISRMTSIDHWEQVIQKEMQNVTNAYELKDNNKVLISYKHICFYMVFDVKIDPQGLLCGQRAYDGSSKQLFELKHSIQRQCPT